MRVQLVRSTSAGFLLLSPRRVSSWTQSSFFSTHPQRAYRTKELRLYNDIEAIFDSAIAAVNPRDAVCRHFHCDTTHLHAQHASFDIPSEVVVVAFGKASYAMAAAVVDSLPVSTTKISGVVIAKDGQAPTPHEDAILKQHDIALRVAAHPVPDERNILASKEVLDVVRQKAPSAFVVACISGGGSALFCTPEEGLTLDDLQATHTALLQSGLSIQEMNVIRRRLEKGKGGGLEADVALILSDVIGDPLDLIASGPTVSTLGEAPIDPSVLDRLNFPNAVQQLLRKPSQGTNNPCFNCLVGNNEAAVQAAAEMAESLGYNPVVLSSEIKGEASTVGQMLAAIARQQQRTPTSFAVRSTLPVAIIAGGETTVTLPPEHGLGGRNQELALAAAIELTGHNGVVIGSLGTDGSDGPTDAAGGIVDGQTANELATDSLSNHDAYNYLKSAKRLDGKPALYKVRSSFCRKTIYF